MVHLVGAGPGDPELITLRGLQILQTADVIAHDQLIAPELLDSAKSTAIRVPARTLASGVDPSLAQIHEQIVAHAHAGRSVCRLKGGDPFIYGRASEEIDALEAAGVPWEVIPGVTSALAAPAMAGIPITDRHLASTATLVTGHESGAKSVGAVNWAALAAAGGTLIVLMGVATLSQTAQRLVAGGRSPSEPVAVIERATWPDQRVTVGTLADITERAQQIGIESPAVIVVGPVVHSINREPL